MAEVAFNLENQGGTAVITWGPLQPNDNGRPVLLSGSKGLAMSAQFRGSFGGSNVALQVSNNNVEYFALEDIAGRVVSVSGPSLFDLSTTALWVRPLCIAGTGTQVFVDLVIKG